jgi:hypothetical protein
VSKAIEGAAMLAGAVGIGVALFLDPELAFTPGLIQGMYALALGGLSMEAGAIAEALTSNRGMGITTRQPAALRQIVYGTQRIPGIIVWKSTTGAQHDQMNYVIVLAGHVLSAIEALYLDGRQVYFTDPTNTSRGSVLSPDGTWFGGYADGITRTGPGGAEYTFDGRTYCEARFGNQLPTDWNTGLTANDPDWAPKNGRTPSLAGCTYIYLKVPYDPDTFPAEPEIRLTVRGKQVYDPRTSATAYSANWALIVNDILTDRTFGLKDSSVNQAQLVAAANVCDEAVTLASGDAESRFACHMHYDAGTGPGNALEMAMPAAAGRLSRISGEWFVWPAYWQGPSLSFDQGVLCGPLTWKPFRSLRDLNNRVTGTYVAPNFPYNIGGNLYDGNGFYDGTMQNNFGFAFQPTNFPQYACDPSHGYAADQYLEADSNCNTSWAGTTTYAAGDVVSYAIGTYYGIFQSLADANTDNPPLSDSGIPDTTHWVSATNALPQDLSLQTCLSITQAQRVAKITLLRNRQQGSGTLQFNLSGAQIQPLDVMNFTFPLLGWTDKLLEISGYTWKNTKGSEGQAPARWVELAVQETAASVYEWSTLEEQTIYAAAASPTRAPYSVAPPTNLVLTSSAATAVTQPSGSVSPRILVQWDEPLDILVSQIQGQVRPSGSATWTDAFTVPVDSTAAFIAANIVAGQNYDVQVRSLRGTNAATSSWVEIDNFTAGLVLNVQTQDGIGIGSLIGEAFPGAGAAIECQPFMAPIGNLVLSYFPAGGVTLPNDGTLGGAGGTLAQQTLYYVYVVDMAATGGNLTPVATTNPADFRGKIGYFLVDAIVTPYRASGATGATGLRYYPTSTSDIGSRTTSTPGYAYDGNTATAAGISSQSITEQYICRTTVGGCIFQGWPAQQSSTDATLYIDSQVSTTGPVGNGDSATSLTVTVNGTALILTAVSGSSAGRNTVSATIPANTPFSSVNVEGTATAATDPNADQQNPPSTFRGTTTLSLYETYIQT